MHEHYEQEVVGNQEIRKPKVGIESVNLWHFRSYSLMDLQITFASSNQYIKCKKKKNANHANVLWISRFEGI